MMGEGDFSGAKLYGLCDDHLLVYRRDNITDIPFPNMWDFPGGGREGQETPEACVLRELQEEFDLVIAPDRLRWKRCYQSWHNENIMSYFFGAELTKKETESIRFGDEGQYWKLMPIAEYLADSDAIDQHKERLEDFLLHV